MRVSGRSMSHRGINARKTKEGKDLGEKLSAIIRSERGDKRQSDKDGRY